MRTRTTSLRTDRRGITIGAYLILFWWRGIEGFEQPAAVETVDIAPTLADLVGLKVAPREMDGRVLQVGQAASERPVRGDRRGRLLAARRLRAS